MKAVTVLTIPLLLTTGCTFASTLLVSPSGAQHRCEVVMPFTFEVRKNPDGSSPAMTRAVQEEHDCIVEYFKAGYRPAWVYEDTGEPVSPKDLR